MLRSPSFSALSAKIMYFMCAWLSPAKAAFRFSVVFGPMMVPSCEKWSTDSTNVHQQAPGSKRMDLGPARIPPADFVADGVGRPERSMDFEPEPAPVRQPVL